MESSQLPPSNRQRQQPSLRRVSGTVRRLSAMERRSIDRMRRLAADSQDNGDLGSSVQRQLSLPVSAVQSQPPEAEPSESKRREIDLLARERIEVRDFAQHNSGPISSQRTQYRERKSPSPSPSSSSRQAACGVLQTSTSNPWIPDIDLRLALQETIDAQNALSAADRNSRQSTSAEHQAKAANRNGGGSDAGEALSQALALGENQGQVRPGEMTSVVMRTVIELLKFPQSAERDAAIRAMLGAIPRQLNVAANPEAESQDARILQLIQRLEILLGIRSE